MEQVRFRLVGAEEIFIYFIRKVLFIDLSLNLDQLCFSLAEAEKVNSFV